MLRLYSGRELSKILSKKYGFDEIKITGSHLKMRKNNRDEKITIIIPLHKEIKIGTFYSILRQAGIDKKDFL